MRLTSKGNYAISAVLDIAIHARQKHIPLKEVAIRLDVSENYLRQLLMLLRRKNIVGSVRGMNGGYYINKSFEEIYILDIIEAVEGDIHVAPCLSRKEPVCDRDESCGPKHVWEILNKAVREKLGKVTLKELVDEFENREGVCRNGRRKL